jgi:hypothetical protein
VTYGTHLFIRCRPGASGYTYLNGIQIKAAASGGQFPEIVSQPTNRTVVVGSDVSFSVSVIGSAPLSYQWRHNGTNLLGETSASLQLLNVPLNAAGSYSVIVSNGLGAIISSNAVLTVTPVAPPALLPLLNLDFANWDRVKTGFAATGLRTNDFWNGLTFQTEAVAAFAALKRSDGQTTDVGLTVENGGVHSILMHPDLMYQSFCYPSNIGVTVTVTVTNLPNGVYDLYLYGHGDGNLANTHFQVFAGNEDLGNRLTTTNSGWDSINWVEGSQYVVYRGVQVNAGTPLFVMCHPGFGGFTYLNGIQIKAATPEILSQPASRNVAVGQNASFNVVATGSGLLHYQWKHEGTNLVGNTSTELQLANVQLNAAGKYSVTVSNAYGVALSSNAVLTVNGEPPEILVIASNRTVLSGTTQVFWTLAGGTAPLLYQWRHEGTNLVGQTQYALMIENVQPIHSGRYSVVVSNDFGSDVSDEVTMIVNSGVPPQVLLHPTNRTVTAGAPTAFLVSATGTPQLRYQWRHEGTNLVGRTTGTLILQNVQSINAGNYSVVISNDYGSAISSNALLTVNPVVPTNNPAPATLLNVNFATYDVVKTGFSATGLLANDFWNGLSFPFNNSAGFSQLKASDGTVTGTGLTVQNGGGHTGLNHPDAMYRSCLYAQNFGMITTTITNVANGQYDLYLYGHAGANNANTRFQVLMGANDFGSKSTTTNSNWNSANWTEGVQYVVYRGLNLTTNSALVVRCHPGASGYTYFKACGVL